MAFEWTEGYSATWRVYRVNEDTWADAEELEGVTAATVERGRETVGPTMERGTLSVDADPQEGFAQGWYRLVMYAEQDGFTERADIATLWCQASGGEVNCGIDALDVTGEGALWPASQTKLVAGSYAPKGVDGVQYVTDMLSAAIVAPVTGTGAFTLDEHVVFDVGISVLDAAWLVLDAGGYVLRVEGDGTVEVVKKPSLPALELDLANARLLHPGVRHELDYSEVPNRYRVNEDGTIAEAVNDDAASEASTASRGFCVDVVDESPVRVDGETLAAYAARMLEERSLVRDTRTYTREWWPSVLPFDVVRGSISSVGLDGDMRIDSQGLTVGIGVTVEETASREVYAWTR